MAFLRKDGALEAADAVMIGEGELGTSRPSCCGGSSGITHGPALPWGRREGTAPVGLSSRLPASASSLPQPSLGRFVVHRQRGFYIGGSGTCYLTSDYESFVLRTYILEQPFCVVKMSYFVIASF